jgi:tetratricopeptide (TPR) repeat protein
MDDPNVGTILMHRTGPTEEGKTVSMISLAAPKDAKKAYDKGIDAIKKKKFEDAQTNFEKAVETYPKYATAWYELGMLQAGQGKMDMARKYFETSIENDPKFIKPYLQLSMIALQTQKWQELADVTSKTTKLDPFDYPQQFFLNSVANYNLQHFDAAEKSALEAERLDTRHQFPKNSDLLGMILAIKKDYAGAKEGLTPYLHAPNSRTPASRSQLAEVKRSLRRQPRSNKSLLNAEHATGGEIGHRQQKKYHQPEQASDHHQLGQLGAMADVHEEQRYQQHLDDCDRERHNGTEGAEIDVGNGRGQARQEQQHDQDLDVRCDGIDVSLFVVSAHAISPNVDRSGTAAGTGKSR